MPRLPPHFLPRPEDLDALKGLVLGQSGQKVAITGTRRGLSIQGMGGIGKSVLAAAIAHDSEIRQAFPDGVFWLSLGQEPNLLSLQTALARDLGDAQPAFSDVPEGKRHLVNLFQGRTALLLLDDVWRLEHLAAFDVVSDRNQMVVTTRDRNLTISMGAEEYSLELLSESQALSLLAGCTDLSLEALPAEATAIARECGYLPLALSMAGAMLRKSPTRWDSVLKRLQNADLDKIKQQFPDYPYPDLLKALQVSVDALEPELRQRYFDFAVFPEDTPIPEAVLETFWAPEGLDELDAEEVIDELVAKSLVRRGETGLTLHDLQFDYVRKQVADLPGLHRRLIAAYETQCEEGWASGPEDSYFFEQLPKHLQAAGQPEELRALLLDYGWLVAKLRVAGVNSLIADYDLLQADTVLSLVQKTLRLSAHVLLRDVEQLAGRLWGHLQGRETTEIQQLLQRVIEQKQGCWVRPQWANLTPPDGPLLKTLSSHSGWVDSIALSADDKQVISGFRDGVVKLWDLESGQELKTFSGHSGPIHSVALSTDNKQVVSGSGDATVKLWDFESGQELRTLSGHSSSVYSVALSTDNKQVVSGSGDATVKLWDLEGGQELRTLSGHNGAVLSVSLSEDNKRMVSGSADGILKLWDLESGQELKTLSGHSGPVYSVALSGDGKRVVSGSADGTVKLWNLESGQELKTLSGHSGLVTSVALSAANKRVVSGSADRTVKLWNLESGQEPQTLTSHDRGINSVALSADGKRVVSGSSDNTVKLWDLESGQELKTFSGHSSWVNSVALSGDGKRVVSGSADGLLKLWDLESGQELRTFSGHSGAILSLVLSEDDKWIISGSLDNTVKLWDLESGQELKTFSGHSDRIYSLALSADGKRVVSSSLDNTVKLWDLESRQELKTLSGHSRGVLSVAMSADGKRAISGALDNTVKLWDFESGVELRTLSGHSDYIRSVAFSADGKRAVSGSDDKTLKLWDLESGGCIATFYGDHTFYCFTLAPDNFTLVAGDTAGIVHFFQLMGL